jgi:hypothetical protein
LIWVAAGLLTLVACIGIDLLNVRGHDPLPEIHDEQLYSLARHELAAATMLSQPLRRAMDTYRRLAFEAGPLLAPVTLLLVPWIARRRWMAFAVGTWIFVIVGMCLGSYFEFHLPRARGAADDPPGDGRIAPHRPGAVLESQGVAGGLTGLGVGDRPEHGEAMVGVCAHRPARA